MSDRFVRNVSRVTLEWSVEVQSLFDREPRRQETVARRLRGAARAGPRSRRVEELEPPAERVEDARMAVDAALSGAPSTGG